MAEFHFVEDYEKHVARPVRDHPIDEAMSLAVGGAYDIVGRIEAEALVQNGLRDGMRLADIGCGSGRTAVALAIRRASTMTVTISFRLCSIMPGARPLESIGSI